MNEEKIIKLYSKEYCILINKSWFGNVTDVSIIKVKIYLLDLKINLKITNLIKLSCFRTRVQMSFWKTKQTIRQSNFNTNSFLKSKNIKLEAKKNHNRNNYSNTCYNNISSKIKNQI